MWFSGGDGSNGCVGYADSWDGIDWEKHNRNPILCKGSAGEWDSWVAHWCSVIKDGTEYKMWYSGGESFTSHRIGYATSPDGITWSKYAENPVLEPQNSEDQVWFPHVLKDELGFHMWYGCTAGICYASSDDGIVWDAVDDPVLPPGDPGKWDEGGVLRGRVLKPGDAWMMWYVGFEAANGEIGRIGYASNPLLVDCNRNGIQDELEPDFDGDDLIDGCDDDIDDDSVPNEPDVCDYTPLGAARIILDSQSCLYGTIRRDLDGDCDCDLADYARFVEDGLTGPNE